MSETSLYEGEPHPMAANAFEYVKTHTTAMHKESIASVALSGDRCAQICWSTLERMRKGQPVSDRYVLGLAWMIKELNDE